MLFRVSSNNERRNVDNLLANTDVALADKNSGVVDGLGKVELENLGLQSAFHEDLGGQLQDVIKGVLILSKDTVSLQAADKRRGFEKSLWVLDIQSEQGTGSLIKQFYKHNRFGE